MKKNKPKANPVMKKLAMAMNFEGAGRFELLPIEILNERVAQEVAQAIENNKGKVGSEELAKAVEGIFKSNIKLLRTATDAYYLIIDEGKYKCQEARFHKDSDLIMLVSDLVSRYTGTFISPEQIVPFMSKSRVDLKLRQKPIDVEVRRAGSVMSTLYLDLGDGEVAIIDKEGVVLAPNTEVPVLFKTFDSDCDLPRPVLENADFSLLFKYVNLQDEHQRMLLVCILCFMIAGDEGCPIVFFTGTAGSGKTEAARLCISLIDNSTAQLRRFSQKLEDFYLACFNKHVVGYDNVTSINKQFMDVLCLAVTNGYVTRRMLYENTKEVQIQLSNPIIMTAIQLPELPPDVVDRAIYLNFERFTNEQRITKQALYDGFAADAGSILGGLLQLISKTMAVLVNFKPKETSRLADFSTFCQAMAIAMGKQPEDFLYAHRVSEGIMSIDTIDNVPILEPILKYVNKMIDDEWVGTASEFERLIRPTNTINTWPRSAGQFGRLLSKYKTTLSNFGVDVVSSHHNQRRALRVTRLPSFQRMPITGSSRPPKKPSGPKS